MRGVSAPRVLRDGRGVVLNRLRPLFGLERFVTQPLCLRSGGVTMIAAAMCKRWVNALRFLRQWSRALVPQAQRAWERPR
jgi:hypothetical protein